MTYHAHYRTHVWRRKQQKRGKGTSLKDTSSNLRFTFEMLLTVTGIRLDNCKTKISWSIKKSNFARLMSFPFSFSRERFSIMMSPFYPSSPTRVWRYVRFLWRRIWMGHLRHFIGNTQKYSKTIRKFDPRDRHKTYIKNFKWVFGKLMGGKIGVVGKKNGFFMLHHFQKRKIYLILGQWFYFYNNQVIPKKIC